ncbi:MAG: ABC transporter permease [Melioribacteraceae bacterium]|nr:ABC transporter permease [Melioribacteraceae bacterium]MCF8263709.1 ABC transporter permease [Melioribacteraceae bacterium]MCF8432319.1 ABC transporter permease [Melioribacteraceae bacterium]
MFRNYLKISFRNLYKDKLHSTINILGLSIGISVAVLMFLYVTNEFSYDSFHKKSDRIFQAVHTFHEEDGTPSGNAPHAPIPFGPAMENEFPEVEFAIRLTEEETFVRSEKLIAEEEILMSDRKFFEVFTFEFKYGNSSSALDAKYSCVLTQDFAIKYFGDIDPTGKTLEVLIGDEYIPVTVGGVITKIPYNSSLEFNIVMPYDLLDRYEWFRERRFSWNSWNSPTYIVLRENAQIENVELKMIGFWEKYYGENFEEQRTSGRWKFDWQPIKTNFTPIEKVRFSDLKYTGMAKTSDPVFVYILAGIGLGILLLACINFMNLSISRGSTRIKEIAVRKVIGAEKSLLVYQFLGEAIFVSFSALILGITLVVLFLPTFNSLVEAKLSYDILFNWQSIAGILSITLLTGLIAGSYPAFVLSSLKPVTILSRKFKFGGTNYFTKALIVLQFSLAVFFILGTLIISEQLDFIQNKNLGFDEEQIVNIHGNYESVDTERVMNILKTEFQNDTEVIGISGIRYSFSRGYDRVGFHNSQDQERRATVFRVDQNFIDFMSIEIVDGRNFLQSFSTDSTDAVIVNQALVKAFEISNPVGSRLDGFKNRGLNDPVIVGVVKDFHFSSLERPIEPAILYISPVDAIQYIYAKLAPNKISGGLKKLEQAWNRIQPEIPFQFSFLDEDLDNQYQEAELRKTVINYSSIFAIFIAGIGLFGMSSFSAARRKKEIGIRKILGASFSSVVNLMGKEFLLLVAVSNLIACPFAYLVMQSWLENYAYRISISPLIFVTAGIFALFIAMISVGYQIVVISLSNPVNSIREE